MLTLFDRWFGESAAPQGYLRSDYVVLALLVAGGAFLRFWGLDNVGLHGDEETMAMPAMAILETGHPYLPSGMYYARALLNIYAMSASAFIFGESEWAFRLPSALVGSLAALAAFFLGRRFLSPQFNLAFVASVALLPSMIEISQTARMYVFFVTGLIWFGACVFRWERTQRMTSLVLALVVWIVCLHFHTLSILAAPLFLFPGINRKSWKLLIQGVAAFAVGGLLYYLYSNWISGKYPQEQERPPPLEEEAVQAPLDVLMSNSGWLALAVAAAVGAFIIVLMLRAGREGGWTRSVPVLLVCLGLAALAVLQYHLAGILFLFGIVFWFRTRALPLPWLAAALAVAAVVALVHVAVLYTSGLYPGRKIVGAVIGLPSVWPILRFLQYSVVAGVLYCIVLLVAFTRFSRGHVLPVHFLYFVMAVWAPLLIIGMVAWYIPPRYAQGQLVPFLLCTFAGLAFVAYEMKWLSRESRLSFPEFAGLMLISLAIVNPIALGRAANPAYGDYPDHKGAAEFIKGLELQPEAVLIAEDVLQQTYYLGKVDYWLREIDNAHGYSVVRQGQLIDQYTATPVIGTGAELERVLEQSDSDVYVIGTGENFTDGQQIFRGRGIREVLQSEGMEVVYEGRDGKTKVWKRKR